MAEDVFRWATDQVGGGRVRQGYRRLTGNVVGGNTALLLMPQVVNTWTGSQTSLQYALVAGQTIAVYQTNDDVKFLKIGNYTTFNWTNIGSGLSGVGGIVLQFPLTALRIDTTGGASAGFVELLA